MYFFRSLLRKTRCSTIFANLVFTSLVEQRETPSAARRLALRDLLIVSSAVRSLTRAYVLAPLFDQGHGDRESCVCVCVCVCLSSLPYLEVALKMAKILRGLRNRAVLNVCSYRKLANDLNKAGVGQETSILECGKMTKIMLQVRCSLNGSEIAIFGGIYACEVSFLYSRWHRLSLRQWKALFLLYLWDFQAVFF